MQTQMSHESPTQRNRTRGRSVAQHEVLANGGRGRKIAEYPTITAASKTSQISYHIIRGILDGKHPKPEQYYWVEIEGLDRPPSSIPPPLPNRPPPSSGVVPVTSYGSPPTWGAVAATPHGIPQPHPSQITAHGASLSIGVPATPNIPYPHPPTINPVSHARTSSSESRSKKKQAIPSLMRTQVWDRWIGIEKGQVKCPYCQINSITPFFFECGHVVAEAKGGEVSVENLRPICRECNGKMGTQPIDLNKYRLGPGIAGRLNPKTQEAYPSTVDGRRAFIEAHTLTNLRGDIGENLARLKYSEAETLAKDRWQNWVEVYEMCQPNSVLVTEKAMRLHPYSDRLYTEMVCDSSRSGLSRALRKLAL
jgi:5-methylcytosine-specific restriction endonuclease McrA